MTMATPDCILSEKILRSSMLANVDDVTGMFTGMEEYTTRAIFAYVTAVRLPYVLVSPYIDWIVSISNSTVVCTSSYHTGW